jgi:hypothetical protein
MSKLVEYPVCWDELPVGCSRKEQKTARPTALFQFLTSHVFRSEEDGTSIWKGKDKANAMIAELCQILEPTQNRPNDDLTLPLHSPQSFSISDDEEHSDTEDANECNEECFNYALVDGLEYELEEDDGTSDHGRSVYGTVTSTLHQTKEPQTLAEIYLAHACRGLGPGTQGSS